MSVSPARFEVKTASDGMQTLAVSGDWTIWTVNEVSERLKARTVADAGRVDLSGLGTVDTSGAYLIDRLINRPDRDAPLEIVGASSKMERLLGVVREGLRREKFDEPHRPGVIMLLDRAGRGAVDAWKELLGTLSFIGETMATLGRLIIRPSRIRWTSVVSLMEEVGIDALPIVTFLSFFIGLVIAFIGANLLAMFNASVFTVELVGIGVLREFGAVLTAIILAGRTNSAFTAQIGAMKMREEVDAMRVTGLDPMEALVAPRLIALLVMTPLLTFAATIAGVVGGMFAAWIAMGISPILFIERFQDTVPAQHFWVGLIKTPVFAMVVALVGCRQGMLVEGNVLSLGQRTTTSVVQAIFLVISIDAVFAIIYYLIDV